MRFTVPRVWAHARGYLVVDDDFEFQQFRQQLGNRPQRRRLGIHLDQDAALELLADDTALRAAFDSWRARSGGSNNATQHGVDAGGVD